jgi:type IV pilus assembly protein PilO
MELGLNKLPWYGQIAVFLLVSLAGWLVFHVYWVAPSRDEIAMRQLELNQKRTEVIQAQQTASRVTQVREEVAEIEVRFDELSAVLPGEKDAGALLRRLQSLATQANLSIRAFTPQAATVEELHSEWPSRLELVGTYHNLGLFFDRVSKFSQVINISDVVIEAIDPPQLNATVSAECTATTFVLNETPLAEGTDADGDGEIDGKPEV